MHVFNKRSQMKIYIYKRWNYHLQYKICYNIFKLSNLYPFYLTFLDMCKRLLHIAIVETKSRIYEAQLSKTRPYKSNIMETYRPCLAFVLSFKWFNCVRFLVTMRLTKNDLLWLISHCVFLLNCINLCVVPHHPVMMGNKTKLILWWICGCTDSIWHSYNTVI